MNHEELLSRLFELQDAGYRELQIRTIPSVDPDSIIGVRTPELRSIAKDIYGSDLAGEILNSSSHKYFEEMQLHAFLISREKDIDRCICYLDAFLPAVDNWATCDQMIPKVIGRNHETILPKVYEWIGSDHVFTVRFAVKVLMDYFLDDHYDSRYPELVASLKTDEYYLQMMIAWYFATALAKQYNDIVPYLEQRRLDHTVHKMTIRKVSDSFRISDDRKKYLRSL
ncbi:3-methyladenine DNA glycosylase AlkD [Ruminococcaceae bacterium YRB3002]|nr:3-methyladenine DNA glycosylase AlkD [Ruminococcaceae bacterium YRB3002]